MMFSVENLLFVLLYYNINKAITENYLEQKVSLTKKNLDNVHDVGSTLSRFAKANRGESVRSRPKCRQTERKVEDNRKRAFIYG